MTATPDKRDDHLEGRNVYEIFDHQIACEIRLKDAMEEDLLCPFHYFGITDMEVIADEGRTAREKLENFRYLTSDERVAAVMEQAEYFGFSGERVKGLIFCSRIDEAKALSEKFNQKGWRTMVLSGSDPEINQVIMLRPTQSPIVFIQQLGRGLRKAEGKEYVVVLDFIGNYRNNFMIPIALSGDRSYNKDNIRRYITEGGRVIRENYQNLKNIQGILLPGKNECHRQSQGIYHAQYGQNGGGDRMDAGNAGAGGYLRIHHEGVRKGRKT